MQASYSSTCPACGRAISAGDEIGNHPALDNWVHEACRTRNLPPSRVVEAARELAKLRGKKLRAAAMSLGATVTRDGRYVEDSEVRARAAAKCPSPDKLAAAVALATNTGMARPGPDPFAAAQPSAHELAEAAKRIIAGWLDQRGSEVQVKLNQQADLLSDGLARKLEDALSQVRRTELVVKVGGAERVVAGEQHRQFEHLLRMLGAGCNVWVAGPAGSGKTHAARVAAEALGVPFHFNGAIDSEYKLSGFVDAQGRVVSTAFREAWTRGGVYLFDEVDASMPSALLAFNAALAGNLADFPGTPEPTPRHADFRCVAAANTWGHGGDAQYVGRSKMDAAFLDRFVKLPWDYDEALETKLAGSQVLWAKRVQVARATARARGLKVVISPRATLYGAALIGAGFTELEAAEATFLSGLDATSSAALSAVLGGAV